MAQTLKPVHVEEIEDVVIRFAGNSGDGMQLTGTQFTNTAAIVGNDISTMPDFPAEIRAPVGTLAGVSGFQVHLSSEDIFTPGDEPQVLVAMNPAALKASLGDLAHGRHDHRQHRRVYACQPEEGRIHLQSPGGRIAEQLPFAQGSAQHPQPPLGGGYRGFVH